MPRRFVDYLPDSSARMAYMPKKQPQTQRVPSPPHDTYLPSDHSESQDGLLSISHPAAHPFETEPDSMGLYRVYPTCPTLFPPDDSYLISLGNRRGRGVIRLGVGVQVFVPLPVPVLRVLALTHSYENPLARLKLLLVRNCPIVYPCT